ncbi:unnamed protein product [Prorocentrum cordatum]|uniref:Uncharacterized protein n=1 Tax=Prorocentrum cordatum TaxID=2364126 RepID=A0ABN9Q9Q1_9DINO|nr:unnamed protein product [Polarella glacialis]
MEVGAAAAPAGGAPSEAPTVIGAKGAEVDAPAGLPQIAGSGNFELQMGETPLAPPPTTSTWATTTPRSALRSASPAPRRGRPASPAARAAAASRYRVCRRSRGAQTSRCDGATFGTHPAAAPPS